MGIPEKIRDIEQEIARTQKNKATEYHIGRLKGQLAKLRGELIEGLDAKGGKGAGFEVSRAGHGRVALIGFPSVGKSTLMNYLVDKKDLSAAASYEFTTLECVPGLYTHKQAKIQILDLPGIIDGAADNVGRGRQVIAACRSADLLLVVLDLSKALEQKEKILRELDAFGIRVNRKQPRIRITFNKSGGITYANQNPNASPPEERGLAMEQLKFIFGLRKIQHATIIDFEADSTLEDISDVLAGTCEYKTALYIYNKADCLSLEEIKSLAVANRADSLLISGDQGWNIEVLKELIYQKLDLIRVFSKKQGQSPCLDDPIILAAGRHSLKDAALRVHTSLIENASSGLVWGTSVPNSPLQVPLKHMLADEDVFQINAGGSKKKK